MSGELLSDPLLAVEDLHTYFETERGTLRAVDGVSFGVESGETVCLVGESGSGKTVTCESITQLLPTPPGEIVAGEIRLEGEDLTRADESRLREVRGDRVASVFQNPQGALDPVYSVGEQLTETIQYHRDVSDAAARERAVDLLERVGIPRPDGRIDEYPHQFSGGMKQRVVLAMALANDPDLLICDEPTTALDVTVEADILDLLLELQAERGMAILFVTHDLGVVAGIADRVVVMYGGKVMEQGTVREVFKQPKHPYTRALLRCLPGQGRALEPIGGDPPDPVDPPDGCRFHPRCPHAVPECESGSHPKLYRTDDARASCLFYAAGRDASHLEDGSATLQAAADDRESPEQVDSSEAGERATGGEAGERATGSEAGERATGGEAGERATGGEGDE